MNLLVLQTLYKRLIDLYSVWTRLPTVEKRGPEPGFGS